MDVYHAFVFVDFQLGFGLAAPAAGVDLVHDEVLAEVALGKGLELLYDVKLDSHVVVGGALKCVDEV